MVWYFRSLGPLTAWLPFQAVRISPLSWHTLFHLVPELLAVTVVALMSLVTKVSSIAVGGKRPGISWPRD